MGVEGSLLVRVAWDGRSVSKAEIESSRPVDACRVFQGKPPEQAAAMLPLLYTVCRTAQSVAAAEACQRACGVTPRPSVRRMRQRLVLAEIAQEYLWRFSLDWPASTGLATDAKAYAARRNELNRLVQPMLADAGWRTTADGESDSRDAAWEAYCIALSGYVEREVLGMPAHDWSGFDSLAELRAWSGKAPGVAARVVGSLLSADAEGNRTDGIALMPPAAELAQVGGMLAAEEDFARSPHWRGQPLETGALARMQGHPLVRAVLMDGRRVLARAVARLLELAALPQGIRAASGEAEGIVQNGAGVGEAWVETARGLLLHRVEIAGGRVSRYRILAPTEWNFHPRGALMRELTGMRAADEAALRGKIARAMLALDPCVGYQVEVMRDA